MRGVIMESMKLNIDVKNVLNQYRQVKKMIVDLEEQIDRLDDRIQRIKSGNISGMPRGGKTITIENLISEKIDLERRKEKFKEIGIQKKKIVQSNIDTVISVKHNRFLTLYFIKCLSVTEIARLEEYSSRHAFRIFAEALGMVDVRLESK